MAEVRQRTWKLPGQRTRRLAWGFTVTINGKRVRQYRTEWTKDDAERELAKVKLGLEQSKAEAQAPGITLKEAAGRYLAAKTRKKSLETDKLHLAMFRSAWGDDTPLAQITGAKISAWKAERLATVSRRTKELYKPAGVNRPLALLRHMLRLAHEEWELLPSVPKIRLEREAEGRLRWLSQEEIAALLAACQKSKNPELYAAVVIAINTGLCRAELLGLTWDRVDRSRGVIRLELTKSGRRREVPLNDDSDAALSSLGPKDNGRVFRAGSIRTCYENAVIAAKLDDVTFHTLRHTFASWSVQRGVSLSELKELMGHRSITMTMKYAHLAPGHLRSAVSRLAGLTGFSAADTLPRAQARAHELSAVEGALAK